MMTERELEGVLRSSLAMPAEDTDNLSAATDAAELAPAVLRRRIAELRSMAECVGAMPVGYPFHARIIIRIISALLPWYTRSLREFDVAVVDTIRLLADRVDALGDSEQHAASSKSA
jgi:hypothetical protein